MALMRHVECMHQCVFAAESDTGKMRLAACFTALSPTDNDRGDIQEIFECKFQRRNEHAGTCVTDGCAIRIDIERCKRVRDGTLLMRSAICVHRRQLRLRY